LLVDLAEVESQVAASESDATLQNELANSLTALAQSHKEQGEWEAASKQFEAVRDVLKKLVALSPEQKEELYRNRLVATLLTLGHVQFMMRSFDPERDSYFQALGIVEESEADSDEVRSMSIELHTHLADTYGKLGNAKESVKHLRNILLIDPNAQSTRKQLAWLLATSDDESVRDGEKGVEMATKLSEEANWEDCLVVDTLAAALAEVGRFDEAVRREQQAIRLAPIYLQHEFTRRLNLYQNEMIFRPAD